MFCFLVSNIQVYSRKLLFLFPSPVSEVNLFLSLWKHLKYLLIIHENVSRGVVHGSLFDMKLKTFRSRKVFSSVHLIISAYSLALFSSSEASARCWIFWISFLFLLSGLFQLYSGRLYLFYIFFTLFICIIYLNLFLKNKSFVLFCFMVINLFESCWIY